MHNFDLKLPAWERGTYYPGEQNFVENYRHTNNQTVAPSPTSKKTSGDCWSVTLFTSRMSVMSSNHKQQPKGYQSS